MGDDFLPNSDVGGFSNARFTTYHNINTNRTILRMLNEISSFCVMDGHLTILAQFLLFILGRSTTLSPHWLRNWILINQ